MFSKLGVEFKFEIKKYQNLQTVCRKYNVQIFQLKCFKYFDTDILVCIPIFYIIIIIMAHWTLRSIFSERRVLHKID